MFTRGCLSVCVSRIPTMPLGCLYTLVSGCSPQSCHHGNPVHSSSMSTHTNFLTSGSVPVRWFSIHHGNLHQKVKPKQSKQITETTDEKPFGQLSTSQKVARAGKDATYTGIFIAGFAVTGLMFYAIGRELLSGQSPSGIYGRALKLCRKHDELTCAIGTPVKGYGEMNRRGRRRHVSHTIYERDGTKYMRIKFYIEGPDGKGTVHLEAKQNERNKYEFRYIFAEIEDGPYSTRTFIIEDNR